MYLKLFVLYNFVKQNLTYTFNNVSKNRVINVCTMYYIIKRVLHVSRENFVFSAISFEILHIM